MKLVRFLSVGDEDKFGVKRGMVLGRRKAKSAGRIRY